MVGIAVIQTLKVLVFQDAGCSLFDLLLTSKLFIGSVIKINQSLEAIFIVSQKSPFLPGIFRGKLWPRWSRGTRAGAVFPS